MDVEAVTRVNRALNKMSKLYRAAKAKKLAVLGLYPGQDVLVWVLAQEATGTTISELAERLGVEQPTATKSLNRMESAALFTREPVPGDRRQVRIVLTAQGRDLVPLIEDVWAELAFLAMGTLDTAQQALVLDALERANDGLRDLVGDAATAVLATE